MTEPKKANIADVYKTIEDVVRDSFSKKYTLTVVVTNQYIPAGEVDNSKLGIAFGSYILEKYVTKLSSAYVPMSKKKGVETFYLFIDAMSSLPDAEREPLKKEAVKLLNKSDIVLVSTEIKTLGDYAGYFHFLDLVSSNASQLKNEKLVGNILVAKHPDAPSIDMAYDKLSKVFAIPKGGIIHWVGDSTSTLKSNIDGFENVKDDMKDTMGAHVKMCVDGTMRYMIGEDK